ncbi:MAG: glutathione S-transferase family protein, partial [Gammaproteobacteria bacterium]
MLTLYQFPISHYCEKIRWALDYKRLDYQVKNLLPGMHRALALKMAESTTLPILVHDDKAVQNSNEIIDYLDRHFPENPLTPTEPHLREEALAWENFADEHIGIPVRTVCYQILLDHPEVLVPLFTEGGPWYGPMFMKIIFPKLSRRMRALMKINEKTA